MKSNQHDWIELSCIDNKIKERWNERGMDWIRFCLKRQQHYAMHMWWYWNFNILLQKYLFAIVLFFLSDFVLKAVIVIAGSSRNYLSISLVVTPAIIRIINCTKYSVISSDRLFTWTYIYSKCKLDHAAHNPNRRMHLKIEHILQPMRFYNTGWFVFVKNEGYN